MAKRSAKRSLAMICACLALPATATQPDLQPVTAYGVADALEAQQQILSSRQEALTEMAAQYPELSLEISCDHGCLIGSLCFNEYHKQYTLNLERNWSALAGQQRQVVSAIKQRGEGLTSLAANVEDARASDDRQRTTEDLIVLEKESRKAAEWAGGSLEPLQEAASSLIHGVQDYWSKARQEIESDERCSNHESEAFTSVETEIDTMASRLQSEMAGIHEQVQAWQRETRAIADRAQRTLNRQIADEESGQ